jgi:tetratricopeptide (TPR) repeat protein
MIENKHLFLRSVACLLLIVQLAACSDSKETRLQRFLLQGNEMVEARNYEKAIEYYNAALTLDSCFAEASNNLGTLYYNERDYGRAIDYYSGAIRCKPQYPDALMNRANTYYQTHNLQLALDDLERVEKLQPDSIDVHLLKGLVNSKLRNYAAAKQAFRRCVRLDPGNVEWQIHLGTVYYYEKSIDSARVLLERVNTSKTDEPDSYNTLALVEADAKNFNKAFDYINKALSFHERDPYYLNNRGFLYLMINEPQKALEDINESISLEPYNGWAYRNKGLYMIKTSRFAEAVTYFERALKEDPYIENINFYLAQAFLKNGDKQKACEYLQKSIDLKERDISPEGFDCN